MKFISCEQIRQLIRQQGIEPFMAQVIDALTADLGRWQQLKKSPRHATHYPQGVIELMPCADDEFYAFKYVNGHPGNTRQGKLSVIALGLLAEASTGYPLLLSEMTLLTAFRTAAVTALGAKYLARSNSQQLALIGTGAQAEFQVLATASVLPISHIHYYDTDAQAMDKFARNLRNTNFTLVAGSDIASIVADADMIVTATAARRKQQLITLAMLKPGVHIHGLGGDCPGKTELEPSLVKHCKIVTEFNPQSRIEGEIQNATDATIHAELWELVSGLKKGRENSEEITLLDAVGFALEDFSILKLVYQLALRHHLGDQLDVVPTLADPKDLFGFFH